MTNSEIKLVVKALCYALGSPERHYSIKVDDNQIMIEYIAAEVVDSEPDPQIAKETQYEIGHVNLPMGLDVFALSDAVWTAVEEIESVAIEYKRM